MKKYYLLLLLSISFYQNQLCSQSLFSDQFSDGIIKNWYGNKNFKMEEKNNTLKVSIDKMPWEHFTLDLNQLKFNKNFIISFDVRSSKAVGLRIDLHNTAKKNTHDEHYEGKKVPSAVKIIEVDAKFKNVIYNLSSKMNRLDKSNLSHICFYADPGSKFKGEIEISNFTITSAIPKNLPIPTR